MLTLLVLVVGVVTAHNQDSSKVSIDLKMSIDMRERHRLYIGHGFRLDCWSAVNLIL